MTSVDDDREDGAAKVVARGLKQKEHDDAIYSAGCVATLVLFFVIWGGVAAALGGGGVAVVTGLAAALAPSFALGWRLTGRYYR